jgi:hypothetical protein
MPSTAYETGAKRHHRRRYDNRRHRALANGVDNPVNCGMRKAFADKFPRVFAQCLRVLA